jgi:GT2 family glycosyltransferase
LELRLIVASAPPAVSVIVPTCGREALLVECLRSILAGDFADFEVVVVDQDPARSLESRLGQAFPGEGRIRCFWIDVMALDRARNEGVGRARGEVLVFVDDDVEVERGWLAAYVEAFASPQAPGAVAGRLEPRWAGGRPGWLPGDREYILGIYNRLPGDGLTPLPEGELPVGANFAVRRSVAEAVGPFDEAMDFSYSRARSMISGGDSLFGLGIRRQGHLVVYQPQAGAWHKIGGRKLTRSWYLRRMFWDGFTSVTVRHRFAGQSTPEGAPRPAALPRARRLLRGPTAGGSRLMHAAGECANSLGVVWARLKLRVTGTLP